MSVESAKAFYKKITTDREFKTQYQNIASDNERREMTRAAGYYFTSEEWETAMAQILEQTKGELGDEQLTAVSGGTSIADPLPFPVTPLYGAPGIIEPPNPLGGPW